jgi:hypothetical protein
MIKIFRILIFVLGLAVVVSSCDLTEHPSFMSEETAYNGATNIQSSLDGVYSAVSKYAYYGNDLFYSTFCNSGMFVSGLGNSNQDPDNLTLTALKPMATAVYTEKPWAAMYKAIERANRLIHFVPQIDDPKTADDLKINDALGEAYFLRAFTYFSLVQMWGEIPLRLEPTTNENIHMAKSPTDVIYAQIVEDAKKAEQLMTHYPLNRPEYPASEAASMLLAKIYMTMATTDDAVPVEHQDEQLCWQLAYESAKKVYGKYKLNDNYGDIFDATTSDGTAESIFELQYNEVVSSNHGRLFTAAHAVKAQTWGRVRVDAEIIDLFRNCYPKDSIRYKETFIYEWVKYGTAQIQKTYPSENMTRNVFNKSFPYVYKHWVKNRNAATPYYSRNFVVYRYADLLLMLAEISNELNNGEQEGYVNEVLARVGLSTDDFVPDPITGADYKGGQDAFRKAITLEYRFELLAEAHDWFNNRRRGYQWFKEMVIDPHNNYAGFNPKVDITLSDDPDRVMHYPIPQSEINTNDLIEN